MLAVQGLLHADPLRGAWKLAWKLRGHSPHSLPAARVLAIFWIHILRTLVHIRGCGAVQAKP